MQKKLKHALKTFFSYSRGDRNAIVILAFIMIVLFVILIVIRNSDSSPGKITPEMSEAIAKWNRPEEKVENQETFFLFHFDPNFIEVSSLDSLDLPVNVKNNLQKYRNAGGAFKTKNDFKKLYGVSDSVFDAIKEYLLLPEKRMVTAKNKTKPNKREVLVGAFDPNTATKEELQEFRFNAFQISNILAYREAGGRLEEKSDLLKIYGIDSVFYGRIESHIEIQKFEEKGKEVPIISIIELNGADSLDLLALPGIGEVFSKRILKYRELLGGYYHKEQLMEVYGMKHENYSLFEDRVQVDTNLVHKIRINFAEYSELIRHPYLNSIQVKTILSQRDTKGMFKNLEELIGLDGFDAETVRKVSPYLRCD